MIARTWHGWTTRANADAFQQLMCDTVIPAFQAREVAGLMQIDLLRRDPEPGEGDEVEFTTLLIFDTIEAVGRFAGPDLARPQIPPEALALIARGDPACVHRTIIERRIQPDHARGRTE